MPGPDQDLDAIERARSEQLDEPLRSPEEEHEAALQAEADGLDAIAAEQALDAPIDSDALAQLGLQAFLQQTFNATNAIEQQPEGMYAHVLELLEERIAAAKAASAPPEILFQLEQQRDVLRLVIYFRRQLHDLGTRLAARARILQG